MSRNLVFTAALLASLAGVARADVSPGVISAFRGQLVVTKDELPEGKNNADTIAKIKAAALKVVEGKQNDDVMYWHFHYTAFLKFTGNANLKLDFYTDDKDHKFVANQSLSGVDAKSNVLSGDIAINEDEGLTKNKSYVVRLETEKDQVVAEAKVLFK